MIKQLAFTRFIAAVAIVFFHYGKDITFFKQIGVNFLVEKASIGVSYFFVLSGFVMVVAYSKLDKINSKDYLINRFARIYPLYLLALLIVIFLYFNSKANFIDIFLNVNMLQSWFSGKAMTLNFPGWSLSVELFFYLLFPFLYNRIYQKKKFKFLLTVILSIWVFTQILFYYLNTKTYNSSSIYTLTDYCYLPILHLSSFLIGNITGVYFVQERNLKERNYLFPIVCILIFIAFVLSFNIYFHNGLLAIPFAIFIYLLSRSNDILTSAIKSKFFIYLGEISFGIYILQYPVFMVCTNFRISKYFHLKLADNSLLLFFIKLFILIIVSSLSYFLIENPLRNRIKKIKKIIKTEEINV